MPHDLATFDGQTAMMYYGKPPWHRLGTRLDKPATAVEAIRAAQLDWEVTKERLFITSGSRLTEYVDHGMGYRDGERHLDAIWFGSGYLSKARAYRVAVQSAEAWRN